MPGGPEAIVLYYRIAPTIVAKIESLPHSRLIFTDLYNQGIGPALDAIGDGRHEEAYRIYRRMVLDLGSSDNTQIHGLGTGNVRWAIDPALGAGNVRWAICDEVLS